MSTCLCHRTRERLSTYIFDTMKLKVIFLLNCESSKYIAKLFSLSILSISPRAINIELQSFEFPLVSLTRPLFRKWSVVANSGIYLFPTAWGKYFLSKQNSPEYVSVPAVQPYKSKTHANYV